MLTFVALAPDPMVKLSLRRSVWFRRYATLWRRLGLPLLSSLPQPGQSMVGLPHFTKSPLGAVPMVECVLPGALVPLGRLSSHMGWPSVTSTIELCWHFQQIECWSPPAQEALIAPPADSLKAELVQLLLLPKSALKRAESFPEVPTAVKYCPTLNRVSASGVPMPPGL